ncbi:hypothetical protein KJ678_03270 [Patescibacteria group bacterium]|nr:hypothetical protein [Patescibacteria group bacterium]
MGFGKKIAVLFLLIVLCVCFAQKINLTTADLGRHIRNGEYVFKNPSVLYTNFYSYTEPDFKTVNHHWLFGVLSYLIWSAGGFKLVSIFFILVNLASFSLFFLSAKKVSSFSMAFFLSLWLIPLIIFRKEIRPEMISYLFSAIFIYCLLHFKDNEITFKKLCAILVPIQLIWVNTHIFFIFGLFLAGIFTIKSISAKKFVFLMSSLILISFINPAGIKGFLEPFNIFREYGYMIAENQSVIFMQKRFYNLLYLHFEISFAFILGGFLLIFLKSREDFKKSLSFFCLFLISGLLAFKLNRLIALNGLIFLLTGSFVINRNASYLFKKHTVDKKLVSSFLASLFLMLYLIPYSANIPFNNNFGIGLLHNNGDSAKFFKDAKLHGPIFNNYDIGSYLIFHLFPNEQVFVDNRPEAYSPLFFRNTYVPMQENENL